MNNPFERRVINPHAIQNAMIPEFMPLKTFMSEEIKKYIVDEEAYRKSKHDCLSELVKAKQNLNLNNK